MTARSRSWGNPLVYRNGTWVYANLRQTLREADPCWYCRKKPKPVRVRIPADLSSTGRVKWRICLIDACIAPLVTALQKAGVRMRGSCCGHHLEDGHIDLQDGRVLVVRPAAHYWRDIRRRNEKNRKNKKRVKGGRGVPRSRRKFLTRAPRRR